LNNRVVITGLGAISALGHTTGQFWDALKHGRTGIQSLTCLPTDLLRIHIGAAVPDYRPEDHFAPGDLPLLDRFSQFALLAAREAVTDSGLDDAAMQTAAAIIGTGCGGKGTEEETYQCLYEQGKSRVNPLTLPKGMPSAAASQVSMQLGITGPVFSVTSACASAAHATSVAMTMIRCGMIDAAITGGTDAPFTYGLMKSWEALRVLSNDTCRPFSMDRSGLVLGEGAGMVVLESLDHAQRRGAVIHAELAGCGMSADASHITKPSAVGATKAMLAALADAALSPSDVDYINAHGTGTLANDVMESLALREVFGDHADRLLVSATKSMHGHSLGAAGAHELVATVLALKNGIVPPTANFTTAGDGCDLDYVPNHSRETSLRAALSNSFAFGGLNAVLAVRAWQE
jgi:nodulation protein E